MRYCILFIVLSSFALSLCSPIFLFLFIPLFLLFFIKEKKMRKLVFLLLCVEFLSFQIRHFSKKSNEYVGVVSESKENYYLFRSLSGSYYVYEKENQKEEGDILRLKGKREKLVSNAIEEEFDFTRYIERKGYHYSLKIEEEKVIYKTPLRKKKIALYYQDQISLESMFYMKQVLYGYSKDGSAFNDFIKRTHALTFSSIGSLFFYYIRTYLKDKKKDKILFYLFLFPFFLLRPQRLLFYRLMIYEILTSIIKKKKIEMSLLSKNALASSILLLLFPYRVVGQDFLFSMILLLGYPLISSFLFQYQKRTQKIIRFLFIVLTAYLFEMQNYNEINLWSPFFFLISPFIYFMHFLYIFLCLFRSPSVIEKVSKWMLFILKKLQNCSYMLLTGKVSVIFILTIYFFLTLFFLYQAKSWKKKSKVIQKALICLWIYRFFPFSYLPDSLTFMNVGQGDAILIVSRGKTLLVDTGGLTNKNIAETTLIPYFKHRKIHKIDYLLITHHDEDHMGGKDTLYQKNWIEKEITSEEEFPFYVGDAYIQNLNLWRNEAKEENDRSFVLSVSFLDTSFLLMGDASSQVENKMIEGQMNLHHEILKVGHHGSSTSSSLSFLKKVSPKEAVISCGKKNKYGHPHTQTLKNLEKLEIQVRRTDEEGSICYRAKNSFSSVFPFFQLWYTKKERRDFDAISFIRPSRHDARKAM